MKKFIYFSGIACANLLLLGCLFKIFHWPGSDLLLILSILLFSFLFLPAALIRAYKDQEQKRYRALYTVTFIVFFIGMMGALFKVQHWPGAGLFLLVGIPLPFVLFLPVYLYQTRNEKKNMHFLGIMFGLTFLAVFSVLLAFNVNVNALNQVTASIRNNEQVALFNRSKAQQIAPATDVSKKADELCVWIDDLKCDLLNATQNTVCDGRGIKQAGYSQIINAENRSTPIELLFEDERHSRIDELKMKVAAYREALIASGKMDPALTGLVSSLFGTADQESGSRDEAVMLSWEQRTFADYQLVIVLDVLSQIQSNVRLVESELEQSFAKP